MTREELILRIRKLAPEVTQKIKQAEVADRLSTLDALGENNSNALDRFKSAEVVASAAQKGQKITFPFDKKVGANDKLYKVVENVNA